MFELNWPWLVIIISFLALMGAQADFAKTRREDFAMPPWLMPIVVSLAVLGSALYVILSGSYSEAEQKWASGAIGTILGYWLKI